MNTHSIGILGAGQLGLMMAQAVSDWHLEPVFLDPDPAAPVLPFGRTVTGSFRDYHTVLEFGKDKDLVSFEIESVQLEALFDLERRGVKVYPQPRVLAVIHNKWTQKTFLKEHGFPTADFIPLDRENLSATEDFLPAFWKQNTGGYDGKGVCGIGSVSDFERLPDEEGFLEKAVTIEKELAVIVARNPSGEIREFPCVEMVFHPEANLVEYLQAPAQVSESIQNQCIELARNLIQTLDMVGLLAVEFFVDPEGKVLINEMAPRPHNSGHHTIEGNMTSQFQQFWRAILDLPLGSTEPVHPFSAMVNLIGEPGFSGPARYSGMEKILGLPGVFPHLYGKSETRPFRKMGHVSIVADSLADLQQKVSFVKNHLKVIA